MASKRELCTLCTRSRWRATPLSCAHLPAPQVHSKHPFLGFGRRTGTSVMSTGVAIGNAHLQEPWVAAPKRCYLPQPKRTR